MTSLLSTLQSRIDARPWRKPGQRLLVNEILSIQILSAAIVGGGCGTAVGGVTRAAATRSGPLVAVCRRLADCSCAVWLRSTTSV